MTEVISLMGSDEFMEKVFPQVKRTLSKTAINEIIIQSLRRAYSESKDSPTYACNFSSSEFNNLSKIITPKEWEDALNYLFDNGSNEDLYHFAKGVHYFSRREKIKDANKLLLKVIRGLEQKVKDASQDERELKDFFTEDYRLLESQEKVDSELKKTYSELGDLVSLTSDIHPEKSEGFDSLADYWRAVYLKSATYFLRGNNFEKAITKLQDVNRQTNSVSEKGNLLGWQSACYEKIGNIGEAIKKSLEASSTLFSEGKTKEDRKNAKTLYLKAFDLATQTGKEGLLVDFLINDSHIISSNRADKEWYQVLIDICSTDVLKKAELSRKFHNYRDYVKYHEESGNVLGIARFAYNRYREALKRKQESEDFIDELKESGGNVDRSLTLSLKRAKEEIIKYEPLAKRLYRSIIEKYIKDEEFDNAEIVARESENFGLLSDILTLTGEGEVAESYKVMGTYLPIIRETRLERKDKQHVEGVREHSKNKADFRTAATASILLGDKENEQLFSYLHKILTPNKNIVPYALYDVDNPSLRIWEFPVYTREIK